MTQYNHIKLDQGLNMGISEESIILSTKELFLQEGTLKYFNVSSVEKTTIHYTIGLE